MTTIETMSESRDERVSATRPASVDELESLRARLQEAEDTLRAIRLGEVDALVVEGPEGPKTYTLVTADHSYRMLVEQMREAALMLSREGVVLYSNSHLAEPLGLARQTVAGRHLAELACPEDRSLLEDLLWRARSETVEAEVRLRRSDDTPVPFRVSLSPLEAGSSSGICVVAADLTDQKRRERAAAEEQLTRAILEFAGTALLVCDAVGRIVRANRMATDLCGHDVLGRAFEQAVPAGIGFEELRSSQADAAPARELCFRAAHGGERTVLASVRPVTAAMDEGGARWVVTLLDITERNQAEAELRAAKEAADAANRAKGEFMAVMSHELRTPLNAIIGYAQLLELGVPAEVPESAATHAERIRLSATHLKLLIDEILTFSRLEAGRETLQISEIEIAEILREVTAIIEPLATAKQLRFETHRIGAPAAFRTDPRKIRQILLNLLGNAVKFTEQGYVILRVTAADSHVIFDVADSGIGIHPDEQSMLFQTFWQADTSRTRRSGGSGLGLAITRRLVERLHGEIAFTSAPARGSTFTVRLPLDLHD